MLTDPTSNLVLDDKQWPVFVCIQHQIGVKRAKPDLNAGTRNPLQALSRACLCLILPCLLRSGERGQEELGNEFCHFDCRQTVQKIRKRLCQEVL